MSKVENAFYIPSKQKQIRLGLKKLKNNNREVYQWNKNHGKFEKIRRDNIL